MERIKLGVFTNQSGKFMVSDPCYDIGTWCQGELVHVTTGEWTAYVLKSDEGDWGIRCAELIAEHSSVNGQEIDNWELCSFNVGVDSGQAGIFDLEFYDNDKAFAEEEQPVHNYGDNKFYGFCCDLTLSEMKAGILQYGTVSSSGYGDGGYDCFISRNNEDKVVAVKIVFITEEDDDEEDYCDDDN